MKQMKRITIIVIASLLLIVLAFLNIKFSFIIIPDSNDMSSRQIDFITIGTVFAGFSFTALGLLLGLSSEKLIERIKSTSIITNKVNRIITSIIFFVLSVVISLFFILGLNVSMFEKTLFFDKVNSFFYVIGVGYLILGIIYFSYSVYELYDLIKRVYNYNQSNVNIQINKAKEEMENNKKALRNVKYDEYE
mgnify:CR=1 FL=1